MALAEAEAAASSPHLPEMVSSQRLEDAAVAVAVAAEVLLSHALLLALVGAVAEVGAGLSSQALIVAAVAAEAVVAAGRSPSTQARYRYAAANEEVAGNRRAMAASAAAAADHSLLQHAVPAVLYPPAATMAARAAQAIQRLQLTEACPEPRPVSGHQSAATVPAPPQSPVCCALQIQACCCCVAHGCASGIELVALATDQRRLRLLSAHAAA